METANPVQRNTVQRDLVLKAVKQLHNHPTAEQICAEVTRTSPHVSRSTVYRNLGVLCDNGMLMRVPNPSGAEHFDHNVIPHTHLICRICGGCFDIKTMPMPYLIGRVTDRSFTVDDCHIVFSGLCPECRTKQQ